MPIENEGAATNWTLRFKHGRITILLFTEALTPLSTLKAELLDTLRERYPAGLPNPAPRHGTGKQLRQRAEHIAIPKDVKDVELAMLVDQHDTSKGWKALKGGGGGAREKDAMGMKPSPKSVGLRDAGVVAFRFRGEDEAALEDGDGDEDEDEDEDEQAGAEGEFLVQWPSYDETYGEAEPGRGDIEMDEE